MGEGEGSGAYLTGGGGRLFKVLAYTRGAYSKGALIRERVLINSCELPICFGILKFFVSNLILTLFRNIAKSEYHNLEFQNSLRNVSRHPKSQ